MKCCIICNQELNSNNQTWYRAKNYIHKCNTCIKDEKKEQKRIRMNDPLFRKSQAERSNQYNNKLKHTNPITYTCRQMYASSRKRAKALGLDFNITPAYLEEISQKTCPILGVEIKYGGGEKSNSSASLDKVVPSKGYIKGNVQVISMLANLMKSSATPEQMIKFAKWVDNNYA